MPIPIILPKFGFTLESCEILGWLVKPGDTVREGDPIAEVETDKVNMEVEATADGEVFHLMYDVGDDVPVTEIIAFLLAPDEKPPAGWTPPPQKHLNAGAAPAPASVSEPPAAPAPTNGGAAVVTPVARRMAQAENVDLSGVAGTGPGGKITKHDVAAAMSAPAALAGPVTLASGKVPAVPAARRLADELGVELTAVTGTGPGGRIQSDDVRAAASAAPAAVPALAAAPAPESLTEVVPLKGMRKRIADRMQAAFRDAPHIFFDAVIDMRGIIALREKVKARQEKLSVTSIVVKASAWALMRHPMMNATFDGENITLWRTANIGVAVALDNGLIVPVVQGADRLSLSQIQAQVSDLSSRARDGKLTPDDMANGTFSVSNLGMFGVDRFMAIINPPQVGIVAVGRTVEQFVPDANGSPVLRPQMTITVSADHRVVDGVQVAQFVGDLRAVLEDPALLAW